MSVLLRSILFFALGAVPVLAQSPAQLKQELKTKEAAAKKDADNLFQVGQWAAEKAMAVDAKRIYQAVLKLKPDHPGANEALGNELVEGKWLPAKEAEALRKKALAAEYAAKGFVDVDGVWVEKDKVDDAKRGVFHHEGQLVTKEEMLAFLAGKVRHPETGEIIDQKHLEKAKTRYFPIGSEGRWVDEKEADTYHSDIKRPWIVRTTHGVIASTLPLAKINELKQYVDQGCERVSPLFGGKAPSPTRRPVVLIAATETEYKDHGNEYGDGTDMHGSFLMETGAKLPVPFQGDVRVAICMNDKDWGQRYARHAAAIAYAHGIAEDNGAALPLWLLHGIGSYTSRFQNDADAGWFGKQHLQKGGIRSVKTFFSSFAINSEMESKEIAWYVYQAGLLVSFAAEGGDAKVTEGLQAVTAFLSGQAKGKGNFEKLVGKLEALLIEAEPKVAAHLQKLVAKSP